MLGLICTCEIAMFKLNSNRLPNPRVDSCANRAPSNSPICRQIDKPIPNPP